MIINESILTMQLSPQATTTFRAESRNDQKLTFFQAKLKI